MSPVFRFGLGMVHVERYICNIKDMLFCPLMHISPDLSTETPNFPLFTGRRLSTLWMSFTVRVTVFLLLVRIGRIELPLTDWQPVVIPLDHIRVSNKAHNTRKQHTFHLVPPPGLEPG